MALRVLLADESPTIKKVMQISLQDFGVDLKTVQLGLDVPQVAKTFQPDIIFVDILLQKKNGYEVCQHLKADKELAHIPIVLMWSGFMDLDEAKFKECGANDQLEKPFDADTLRNIVKTLVKKTESQDLAKYLVFPDVPKDQEPEMRAQKNKEYAPEHHDLPAEPTSATVIREPTSATIVASTSSGSTANWTMDSFDSIDEFKEHSGPIPEEKSGSSKMELFLDSEPSKMQKNMAEDLAIELELPEKEPSYDIEITREAQSSTMAEQDVDGFTRSALRKLGSLPEEKAEPVNLREFTQTHKRDRAIDRFGDNIEDGVSRSELLANVAMSDKDLKELKIERASQKPTPARSPIEEPLFSLPPQLTEEQLEVIVRSQSKEIIEKIVWKLVPDIAQQLIQQEIKRLMDESKI